MVLREVEKEEPLTEKLEVRFTKRDLALLNQVARARRCKLSDVVRLACAELFAKLGLLEEAEAKTLGVMVEEARGMKH